MRKIHATLLLSLFSIAAIPNLAFTQGAFPNKPIRLIVPLAPAGGGDIVARVIAQHASATLGQPIIVENRAGGATIPGTDLVAKSPADGYTLLLATSSHLVNGSLYKLPYDPEKDFTGVNLIATSPLMLVVNPKVPANTMAELIALAKSKPGSLTYASSGTGGMAHLGGELLNSAAGIRTMHVPYKGAGPAETDIMGGHVHMLLASPVSAGPLVAAGRMKAIAMTSTKRSPAFPNLPTISETLPGFAANTLYAILAPAGTPAAVLARLNDAITKAAEVPETRNRLQSLGVEITSSGPAETTAYIASEIKKWDKIVKDANVKVD